VTIPGASVTAASVIVAEIGADMALPDGWTPDIVGRPVPGTEPKRGQGEVADLARWCAVAQDRAGAIGLSRQPP
jgi:hypothetical protein